jgi:hypothetical protein
MLGDGTDDGTPLQFQNCYDKAWGPFKGRTKPALGNHEFQSSPNGDGYFGYFGSGFGTAPQGWYSYDLGAWHIVVLNSNCSTAGVGGCGLGSPQYMWLQDDLTAHPASCTLAYWHHPVFTSTPELLGNDPAGPPVNLYALLDAERVDVVLSAHSRAYERFAPQDASGKSTPSGIREFVVGTGGGNLDATPATFAGNSEKWGGASTSSWGVLKLTLHPASYDWQFVPIASSTFTDAGSTACH